MFCVSSSRLQSVVLQSAIMVFSGHFLTISFTVNKDNDTVQTAWLDRLFGVFVFSVKLSLVFSQPILLISASMHVLISMLYILYYNLCIFVKPLNEYFCKHRRPR